MIYGYVRANNLANREKSIEKQIELLQAWGVEKIIPEADGAKLQQILEPGDSLHVVSIDRLTRSACDLIKLADYFEKNNITLYVNNKQTSLGMHILIEMNKAALDHHWDE